MIEERELRTTIWSGDDQATLRLVDNNPDLINHIFGDHYKENVLSISVKKISLHWCASSLPEEPGRCKVRSPNTILF